MSVKYLNFRIAFTLIEILVVIGIIGLLSTMLFGLVGSSMDAQERSKTESVIHVVAAAIELFNGETGNVPLPTGSKIDALSGSWYPSDVDGTWDKQQLWWRLNHNMTNEDRDKMDEAALAADINANPLQSKQYIKANFKTDPRGKMQSLLDTVSDTEAELYKGFFMGFDWVFSDVKYPDVKTSQAAGSYGYEFSRKGRVKEALLAIRGKIARDFAQRSFFTYSTLCLEDLADETLINGQTLLDVWGNPIIYVAHSTPDIKDVYISGGVLPVGKRAGGRTEMTDRNGDGSIDMLDWGIQPTGDDLIDEDGSGNTDERDWANILYNSFEGNRVRFYLASAGTDGMFNCVLTNSVNEDNVVARSR